jgi:hypothetical protein
MTAFSFCAFYTKVAPGADDCGARFFGKITNFSYFFSQIFVQFDEHFFPETY